MHIVEMDTQLRIFFYEVEVRVIEQIKNNYLGTLNIPAFTLGLLHKDHLKKSYDRKINILMFLGLYLSLKWEERK